MEKSIHRGCSCFMCTSGKRTNRKGHSATNVVERRYRRATKAELAQVARGQAAPDDYVVKLSATGYTD